MVFKTGNICFMVFIKNFPRKCKKKKKLLSKSSFIHVIQPEDTYFLFTIFPHEIYKKSQLTNLSIDRTNSELTNNIGPYGPCTHKKHIEITFIHQVRISGISGQKNVTYSVEPRLKFHLCMMIIEGLTFLLSTQVVKL